MVPDDGLDRSPVDAGPDFVARRGLGSRARSVRRARGRPVGLAPGEVEDAELLFDASGGENLRVQLDRKCDRPYNVRVLQRVKALACVRVPDLTARVVSRMNASSLIDHGCSRTYAEKSAAAVAAMLAFADRRACHTAPLCPINVPILDSRLAHLKNQFWW